MIEFRKKFGHFNVKEGPASAQVREEGGEDDEDGEEIQNDTVGANIDGAKGPASAQLGESGEDDEEGEDIRNDTEGANIDGSKENNDSDLYTGLHHWVRKQHKCT